MIVLKILLGLALLIVLYLAYLSFMTRHPQGIDYPRQQLQPCPDKPNCVFSYAIDKRHQIAPFEIQHGDTKASWGRLMDAIERTGGEIIFNNGQYCHAVFTSRIFRFQDDVEVLMSDDAIAIRSASRAGTSDMGQNRKRVEAIRSFYLANGQ